MNQRSGQKKNQKTGQKKKNQKTASNVSVLRPKRKTRLNVGRIILFGISLAFIAWAIYPITYRLEQSRELAGLNKQLLEIERQNDELRADIKRLSSDEYIEQRARRLGLSKPDEEIVVVVPETSHKSLKETGDKAEKKEKKGILDSLWHRITSIFSHVF